MFEDRVSLLRSPKRPLEDPYGLLDGTGPSRVSPVAPPSGRYHKEFGSAYSRLFGKDPIDDISLEKIEKFLSYTDEDIDELNKLLKTQQAVRPRPSEVPYFDNELKSISKPAPHVIRSDTRISPIRGKTPATNTFERVAFTKTPFIDIDFPSASHHSGAVTSTGLRNSLEQLQDYQRRVRAKGFNPVGAVYMTPAGVHYIEQGFEMDPRTFDKMGFNKHTDPFYRSFSMNPTPIELAKHPSDFGIMAGGKEGFGRIEVDEMLRRKNPADHGLMARRDIAGLLTPNYSIRTAPKRLLGGGIRVEKKPGGLVGDFVKMRLGTLGTGKPLDSALQATQIHDDAIKSALQRVFEEKHGMEGAMKVSRERASMPAMALGKEGKKALGIDAARFKQMTKLGIPGLALLLLGIAATSMSSQEA